MPTNADRLPVAALVGIFLLALVLRLAAIAFVGPSPNITGITESGSIAANLARGRGYTFDFLACGKRGLCGHLCHRFMWVSSTSV